MAEITYPFTGPLAPARHVRVTIRPTEPGQSRLTYPDTQAVDVISRGINQYTGTFTIIPLKSDDKYSGSFRKILAFMEDCRGSANFFRLPLVPLSVWGPQRPPTDPADFQGMTYAQDAIDSSGTRYIRLDGDSGYTATIGDRINIGERLYRITFAGPVTGFTGNHYRIAPVPNAVTGPLPPNAPIEALQPFVLARIVTPLPELSRTGANADQMTFNWEEVI